MSIGLVAEASLLLLLPLSFLFVGMHAEVLSWKQCILKGKNHVFCLVPLLPLGMYVQLERI